jgi:UDP-2-acetamido-2,6-beta-L-arabino-hexul-4-ose reductase
VPDVVLTGSGGFLGGHVRAALLESGTPVQRISLGEHFDLAIATAAVSGATRVIHLAGVNRADDDEVTAGNIRFAMQLAAAVEAAPVAPQVVVYANSTQADNGSVYGSAKSAARGILQVAAERVGARFEDVALPNLFGEHGRPFYNAVTATFSHLIARGETPTVEGDKVLTLLHAQDAADLLTGAVGVNRLTEFEVQISVSGLLERLLGMASVYARGEIPDICDAFDRNLFNTYRSHVFPASGGVRLTRHEDARGSFFEVIRTHGGNGQFSFSTTEPGITRGDHFHRRKVERFTVLSGTATISLRRVFTSEVHEFEVDDENPLAIDMPTMWAHKITNTGAAPLLTSFWTNDLFDPARPDTIAEAV